MLDRLVASDRYHVLDGQWLPHGRRWQNAPEELRADAAAAGVDYLVLGSITRFSTEQKQRSVAAAADNLVHSASLLTRTSSIVSADR